MAIETSKGVLIPFMSPLDPGPDADIRVPRKTNEPSRNNLS
jgi:hypothetical protein